MSLSPLKPVTLTAMQRDVRVVVFDCPRDVLVLVWEGKKPTIRALLQLTESGIWYEMLNGCFELDKAFACDCNWMKSFSFSEVDYYFTFICNIHFPTSHLFWGNWWLRTRAGTEEFAQSGRECSKTCWEVIAKLFGQRAEMCFLVLCRKQWKNNFTRISWKRLETAVLGAEEGRGGIGIKF
jgi:hypothetical protein